MACCVIHSWDVQLTAINLGATNWDYNLRLILGFRILVLTMVSHVI